jgi:hypothetical protein
MRLLGRDPDLRSRGALPISQPQQATGPAVIDVVTLAPISWALCIDEIFSEVFQNAQRAGSTTVDITTTDNTFIIQDNGHGLLNGIDGFHSRLKLAESNF